VAARAAPRMFPCLDEMFRRHRTGQFHFLPFKPARCGMFRGEQTVPQNHRWNFRQHEGGKFPRKFPVPGHATHPRKNVEQFPALATEDGLHVAIQTAVRPAGNVGVILALRTVKMKGPAHLSKSCRNMEKFQGAGARPVFCRRHYLSSAVPSDADQNVPFCEVSGLNSGLGLAAFVG